MGVFHHFTLNLGQCVARSPDFPIIEDVTDRLVQLPFYSDMSEEVSRQLSSSRIAGLDSCTDLVEA
jgi:hypothetical protein